MSVSVRFSEKDARRIFLLMVAIELCLVAAYAAIHIFRLDLPWGPSRVWFNLNRELSIPTWFSTIQLFVTACALFLAAAKSRRGTYLPTGFLVAAGFIFLFLSADEGSSIHEQIAATAIDKEIDWVLLSGDKAWMKLYAVLAIPVLLVAIRYLRVFWRHRRHETRLVIGGAFIFVVGAVGLELIGYLFFPEGDLSALYRLEVLVEEFCEMFGISLILYAALLLSAEVPPMVEMVETGDEGASILA